MALANKIFAVSTIVPDMEKPLWRTPYCSSDKQDHKKTNYQTFLGGLSAKSMGIKSATGVLLSKLEWTMAKL